MITLWNIHHCDSKPRRHVRQQVLPVIVQREPQQHWKQTLKEADESELPEPPPQRRQRASRRRRIKLEALVKLGARHSGTGEPDLRREPLRGSHGVLLHLGGAAAVCSVVDGEGAAASPGDEVHPRRGRRGGGHLGSDGSEFLIERLVLF